MRISDWSSDVCSSDLGALLRSYNNIGKIDIRGFRISRRSLRCLRLAGYGLTSDQQPNQGRVSAISTKDCWFQDNLPPNSFIGMICGRALRRFQIQSIDAQYRFELCHTAWRSEEHTSELQSLMRISYAVLCLKKKKDTHTMSKTLQYINN